MNSTLTKRILYMYVLRKSSLNEITRDELEFIENHSELNLTQISKFTQVQVLRF